MESSLLSTCIIPTIILSFKKGSGVFNLQLSSECVCELQFFSQCTRGQCRGPQLCRVLFFSGECLTRIMNLSLASKTLFVCLCVCLAGQRRTLKATETSAVRFSRWKLSKGSLLRSVCKYLSAHLMRYFLYYVLWHIWLFSNRYKVSWQLLSPERHAKLVSIHLFWLCMLSCDVICQYLPYALWEHGVTKTLSCNESFMIDCSIRAGLWDNGDEPPGASHTQWREQPGNTHIDTHTPTHIK